MLEGGPGGEKVSNYRTSRNYENLERRIFDGIGQFGIPKLKATQLDSACEFIGFNYAAKCQERQDKGVHFFWMIINLIAYGQTLTAMFRCFSNFGM